MSRPPRRKHAPSPKQGRSKNIVLGVALIIVLSSVAIYQRLLSRLMRHENAEDVDSSYLILKGVPAGRHDEPEKKEPRRRFFRYDEAAPRAVPGSGRVHWLPSIPSERRVPLEMTENEVYQNQQKVNVTDDAGTKGRYSPSYDTDYRALYVFNPSVVPLFNTVPGVSAADNPDLLSPSDLDALTGGDETVRYVVTFRVCTKSNAFGPHRHGPGELLSYLGVALLDENLDIVPGSDIVVDLNHDDPDGNVTSRRWVYDQVFEDCRLFLLQGSFYLCCNAYVWPVAIRRRRVGGGSVSDGKNVNAGKGAFVNFFGDGLELSRIGHHHLFGAGKNFNMFRARLPNNTVASSQSQSAHYYVELFPTGPHEFREMKLLPAGGDPGTFHPFPPRLEYTMKKSIRAEPKESFDTPDTHHNITIATESGTVTLPFFHANHGDGGDSGRDKGTACCISMSLRGKQVLAGISHVKTSHAGWWQKDIYKRYRGIESARYLSRFYAFDASPPFDIVARSGFFCLGFGNVNESRGNPFAGRNEGGKSRLRLFDESFDCPTIHFPSGISEYVGDYSKAIIGYGINDCYPRIIVVEKEEIANRLLGL